MADSSLSQSKKKSLTWADFGIDTQGIKYSGRLFCPRCDQYQLKLDQEKESWYCESCHWAGTLNRVFQTAGYLELPDAAVAINRWHKIGPPTGEKTGWAEFDKLYTVKLGEWTLVTGIPSHGKSEFLDALAVNLARRGWKFGVYSPENLPYENHVSKLAEKFVGKPFAVTTSYEGHSLEKMGANELALSIDWLKTRFWYIQPAEPTLESVLSQAKKLVEQQKVKGIIIDPWNEIEHAVPQGMNEHQYTSIALSRIRRFARTFYVHVWLVAHPTKLKKEKDGRYPVPTPYDVSGSSHFRNKADSALSIWREIGDQNTPDETHVHVQKIRNKRVGRIGVCQFDYDRVTGTYRDRGERKEDAEFPIDDVKKRFSLEGDSFVYRGITQLGPDYEQRPLQWEKAKAGLFKYDDEHVHAEVRSTPAPSGPALWYAHVWQDELDSWEEELESQEAALSWCERKIMESPALSSAVQTVTGH